MSETHITLSKILGAILDGAADDDMEALTRAIKRRRDIKNDHKLLLIKPGDKVRFNSNASPKYIQGAIGTVTKVNNTTVSVDLPEDFKLRKFSGSRGVRTPISIVDKVEAQE